MIEYRSFRNDDVPGIAAVWREQPLQRGLAQPMSAATLEGLVLSKPYFDPAGLIVAVDGSRVVGFAHAGFGPSDDYSTLSTEMGVTAMVLIAPHEQEAPIARELIGRVERYLISQGAKLLYAGGIWPLNPFYLGLYGGSELPGVLATDERQRRFFSEAGYEEIDRCRVLQRDLGGFRPLVDRTQIQLRRQCRVEADVDPPVENWWQACQWAAAERVRFNLIMRGGEPCGHATCWNMQPLAASWGVHAVGVSHLEVVEERRRQGLATFLLGETLRQMKAEGATLAEAQTMQTNAAAMALYAKLGFKEIDQGIVLRKRSKG